ncbi:condensation domain-containing protein [Lentzea sp. NPDC004782]|uniref:condensation domain-containing protein n=1 Tax=Lentzea sp. NPDC004782 TaxID=3154458 RepID=UPI0033B1267E
MTAHDELQSALAGIWRETLGVASIDPDDHFFDLGGNSISNVLISSRARELGIPLTTRLLFDNPTVRLLSAALLEANPALASGGWAHRSTIPLSPYQKSFLEHPCEPEVIELHGQRELDPDLLRAALTAVSARHEALRLRFVNGPTGWTQSLADAGEPVAFIRGSGDDLRKSAADQLDITRGPMLAALLDTDEAGHFLLAVHPLVADRTSQALLLDEIALAYEQLADGEPLTTPHAAAPFSRWSRRLNEWLGEAEADRELAYWRGLAPSDSRPSDTGSSSNARVTVQVELDEERTSALRDTLARQPLVDEIDVLLAGVADAVSRWTGDARTHVDLDCDGRRGFSDDQDFSATVGACTTVFPLVVDVGGTEAGEQVRAVRAARRAVPRAGAGHGALRRLSLDPTVREQMAALPVPEIRVRFLNDDVPALFGERVVTDPAGTHPVDVTARIHAGRLQVCVTRSADVLAHHPVDWLADAIVARMEEIVTELGRGPAHAHSTEDFPLAGLDSEQLTALLKDLATDEDATAR